MNSKACALNLYPAFLSLWYPKCLNSSFYLVDAIIFFSIVSVFPTESDSDSLQPHGLYSPWNSPGQNTGVGSLFLLQGIFPAQGSNWGLLHCRQILYQLSYQGSPINIHYIIRRRSLCFSDISLQGCWSISWVSARSLKFLLCWNIFSHSIISCVCLGERPRQE